MANAVLPGKVTFTSTKGRTATALHVLITRFNVPWFSKRCNKNWMEHRIEIFQHFCLPSVREQTTKNFHWLILLSTKTLGQYEQQIEKLVSTCDFPVVLLKVPNINSMNKIVNQYLSSFDIDWVIASRLDNDDILAMSYMDKMQKRFAGKEKIVRANLGYQLHVEDTTIVLKHGGRSGPFLSVHSKQESGVLTGGDHSSINRRSSKNGSLLPGTAFPIEFLKQEPLWIQIIHGKNLGNHVDYNKIIRINNEKQIVLVKNIKGFLGSKQWNTKEAECR